MFPSIRKMALVPIREVADYNPIPGEVIYLSVEDFSSLVLLQSPVLTSSPFFLYNMTPTEFSKTLFLTKAMGIGLYATDKTGALLPAVFRHMRMVIAEGLFDPATVTVTNTSATDTQGN